MADEHRTIESVGNHFNNFENIQLINCSSCCNVGSYKQRKLLKNIRKKSDTTPHQSFEKYYVMTG